MAVKSIWKKSLNDLIKTYELCDLTRKNFVEFRIIKENLVKWHDLQTALCDLTKKNCTYLHAPEVDLRAGSGITQQNDKVGCLFFAASIKPGNKILQFGKKTIQ